MSKFCPSCGSVVEADAATCPVCGESLAAVSSAEEATAWSTADITPDDEASTDELWLAEEEASAGGRAAVGGTIACPACGASNPGEARFCLACGSSLTEPTAAASKGATPPRSRRSAGRDYLLATAAAIVIAGIVFLIATPEERTGPPQPAATGENAAMPPGHPPTNEPPKLTPEQQAEVTALEKQVKENPSDLEATLKLANIYYDVERHQEAIPLYREYLKKYPDSANVRTDMAFSIASAGDLRTAIDELNLVMRKNPRHQNAAYNLATMYLANRNRDSTLYWLERVVDIDSTTQPGQAAAQILREVAGTHEGHDHPHDSAGTKP